MKELFEKILSEVNTRRLMQNTAQLLEIEQGQTFEHYRQAAEFTAGLIKAAGIENCEIINFPADGKTVYQDKRMPLAWNAATGRLTIKQSAVKFDDPVIALVAGVGPDTGAVGYAGAYAGRTGAT